jgi:predicted 2-oxoglutarate/Fe(II)-dependent dioxygenase YbiX
VLSVVRVRFADGYKQRKGDVEEEVHAVAGRLLIFASGPENVHGVTPITRGER